MRTSDEDYDYKMKGGKARAADDAALSKAAKDAYDEATNKSNADPIKILQRIAKLWFKWDDSGGRRKARNALKQLVAVPLTFENRTWYFEQSLRQAFQETILEDAQLDPLNPDNGAGGKSREKYEQWQQNVQVRAAFLAAIRTEPDEADVRRVMKAIEDVGEDEDPPKPGYGRYANG